MKTLLVLRHGKASQESTTGSDFDRPLTSRGRRQALAVGVELGSRDRAVDAIVASPAARVHETVDGLMTGAGWTLPPLWDRRLYNASFEALLDVIRQISDMAGAALIVGHNPGLHELILRLAEDDLTVMRGPLGGSFPTATLAELSLSVDQWRDVRPGCGRIHSLFRPGDFDD